MPFIGGLVLEQVHAATLSGFNEKRRKEGVTSGTVNRALTIVKLVLKRANARYRDASGSPRIAHLPEIPTLDWDDRRRTYVLSDLEKPHLMSALSEDLQFIATFLLHTGLRSR